MQSTIVGFNAADAAVIVIIAVCVYISAKKGLIRSFIEVGYKIAALILSRLLYPAISKVLMGSSFYDSLKLQVMERLNIGGLLSSQSQKVDADIIGSLNLPQIFKSALLENNNSVTHSFLKVSGVEEYIGGYIAMVIINIICVIIVYFAISIGIRVCFKTLDIFSKLPVIKTANKLGGAVFGFCWATIAIWVAMAFISLFLTQPLFNPISKSISSSFIAIRFYETDVILNMINKIIL